MGGKGQVSLSWSASSDNVGVTAYRVYRNGLLVATPTSPSFVDTGLSELTSYTYTVAAQDAAGNTSATASASATTLDATAPTAPSSVTAKVSGTTVTVKWKASTDTGGVKSYTVLRNGTAIATTTALTYADATAPQGATASYTVTATDNAGNVSAPSTAVTAVVPDKTAPTAPSGLTATAGTKSVTVSWTASTDNVGVGGYYVYRGSSRIATVTPSTLTWTDTGLTSGKSYTYKVVAYDAAGNLGTSATITAKAG